MADKNVIGFALIVGAANGIGFSYFAEGSFSLIQLLGLSPSHYGLSFVALAVFGMLGGLISKYLHYYKTSKEIMEYGIWVLFVAAAFSSLVIVLHAYFVSLPDISLIAMLIFSQMIIMMGLAMSTSNALALALQDYRAYTGTASSLFGFFYYCLISLFTLGMGLLHNGTLLPMPLYFLFLTIVMLGARRKLIKD